MKLHIAKTILTIIFFLFLKDCTAQEIIYLDRGYCVYAYDAASVVTEEKPIRVKIINNIPIPLESKYGKFINQYL